MSTQSNVAGFLRRFADELTEIPTAADKTPDFLVREGDVEYLIEAKDKYPDETALVDRETRLANGQVYESSISRDYNNVMSAVIHKGSRQLCEQRSPNIAFYALWITLHGRDPDLLFEQVESTLYGVTLLADLDEVPLKTRKCFFYDFSEFYRCQSTLDAAIVTNTEWAVLFLNPFSQRLNAVKSSRLAAQFGEAIFHPNDPVANGAAFTAQDCHVSRRDTAAVHKHVQAKYGRTRLTVMTPVRYSAEVRV